MNYKQALLKRSVENILIYPFVFVGKCIGFFYKLNTSHSIFLFFPTADVGGSIKVNADIVACINDKKPLIIFSKKPKDNVYLHLFEIDGVRILNLYKWIDNKYLYFVNVMYRGILSVWINKMPNAIVFGGEALYFYKVLPYLDDKVTKIELSHVNTWLNFSQAYIKFIDKRIFSTQKIKRDVETQYIKNKVPPQFAEKLFFIDNKIDIPLHTSIENKNLEVLFVGRGTAQKRVYLIAEIAKQIASINSKIKFSFVGDVDKFITADNNENCINYGIVSDKNKLNKLYNEADVLILTSAYEGLPIVVMDMMARGKVVLSTAVDGIPDYITHLKNGILVFETDEQAIIKKSIAYLLMLEAYRNLLKTIGKESYSFASNNFSSQKFDTFYKNIFCK